MAAIETLIGGATLAVAICVHIIKTSIDKGRLEQKVEELQECKAQVEDVASMKVEVKTIKRWKDRNENILTIPDHDKAQSICRAEIYKDMNRLERSVNKFVDRVYEIEKTREEKDAKTQEQIQEVHDAVIEIKAYIKNRSEPKIGVY